MEFTRPNQVWAADITYVPMARGFLNLGLFTNPGPSTLRMRRTESWRPGLEGQSTHRHQGDAVVVLVGQDTHNAQGVIVETDMARSLNNSLGVSGEIIAQAGGGPAEGVDSLWLVVP